MFKMVQNRKGFSMIELIVVIAILGVIAAIAVPVVLNTLADSKVKADIATAQSISRAINVAVVNANSDTDPDNDIAAIDATALEDIDGSLEEELTKTFPNLATMTPQSDAEAFTITIVEVEGTPDWSVSFGDYAIDQNGNVEKASE